jgi:hypothetical protein
MTRLPAAMKSPSLLLLVGLGCLSLAACTWLGLSKKSAPEDPAVKPRLVGRIASIPADRRFVLIQSYGKWEVETGSVLVSRGLEERTANLLATGESLGQFAAADVQSGTLEVGDAVFFLPTPAKINPTEPPSPPPRPPDAPPSSSAKPTDILENQRTKNIQKNIQLF